MILPSESCGTLVQVTNQLKKGLEDVRRFGRLGIAPQSNLGAHIKAGHTMHCTGSRPMITWSAERLMSHGCGVKTLVDLNTRVDVVKQHQRADLINLLSRL